MPLYWKDKEIVGVYRGERVISAIYRGSQLVWQAIRSCFGAGFWRGDKPWIGSDAWKG